MTKLLTFILIVSFYFPHAAYSGDTLQQGVVLQNNGLISSSNGRYSLIMQSDGSLVLYRSDGSVFRSMAKHGSHAVLLPNGRFVEYAGSSEIWSSGAGFSVYQYPAYSLVLQNDGGLNIYWSSSPSYPPLVALMWSLDADPEYAASQSGVRYPQTILSPPGAKPTFTPSFSYPATQGACNWATYPSCLYGPL